MFYLYIWHCPPSFTKIGISKNPHKRIKISQANNPKEMKLVCLIEYPDELLAEMAETHICYALSRFHERGEWYDIDTDLLTAFVRFIEISLGNAVSFDYPDYTVEARMTKTKMSKRMAVYLVNKNRDLYRGIINELISKNPNITQTEKAKMLARYMTGDKSGYMSVMRAYKELKIKL